MGILLLALRYRGYLLDTESQLLYGLIPLLLASLFLFEKPMRAFRFTDGLLFLFLGFLGGSFLFAQHPFGFFEFTTFFVGALLYASVRFLKLPKLPYRESFVALGAIFSTYAFLHFLISPADRLSGFFHGYEAYTFYPNAAALLLLPVLIFNVELCLKKTRVWHGLLFLNLAAFMLTFSRAAYLVALCCIVLAGVFSFRFLFKKNVFKKLSLLFLTTLCSLSFALGLNFLKVDGLVVSERLLLKDDAGFTSVSERIDFWEGAWKITQDHPWFGVGPGGFSAFYPSYQEQWLALSDHPHNVLLKLSSEAGIPAAVLFSSFLLLLFLPSGWRLLKGMQPSEVSVWLAAAAFLGHNLLDYNLNFTVLSGLFFVLLAALANTEKGTESVFKKTQKMFYGFAVLSIFVSGITLWEGVLLVQTRSLQELYETNPQDERLSAHLENPTPLPFEMNHFDAYANMALALKNEAALERFLSRFQNYSTYYRWLYFKAQLDPHFVDELLLANGKNELEYHYLFYKERAPEDAEAVHDLLRLYTALLSANAHMTVLSQNPIFAEKLCALYDAEELKKSCETFEKVWALEVYKFNQRYGTSLTSHP
ncbi:O-antigen ligase family protein [Candidatus Peregrinibacteria bacterium]|nr:MAG: O-antigen ligase family protein [Candidatus Peregrinibacteria bacterium]